MILYTFILIIKMDLKIISKLEEVSITKIKYISY
jgi:hypothetical protein